MIAGGLTQDMVFGTQYYRPPFPDRRYWKQDLDRIKEFGLNSIQLWVVWGWVEPEPGVFRFEDYDELMEEAGNRGLGVVLNTIAEIHPYWIHRVIPDSHMVDHLGLKVISSNRSEVNNGLTPGGCTDNPEVLRRMKRFLEEVAIRYKDCDNLLAYDCWNEMRWAVNTTGLVCYCPYTLKAFREWLKRKYGDLDGLNRAWKRRYCSFDDVLPGTKPTWKPFTETMEFESFLQWRIADHARFRYEAIKGVDSKHIVSAHDAEPCVTRTGRQLSTAMSTGNHWDIADQLDSFGISLFPENPYEPFSEEDLGVRIECLRSAAGDKPSWVSELSGFGRDAKKQQRWVWAAYGRGVDTVLFWCWRPEVFGMEARRAGSPGGGGIMALDGYEDRRKMFQDTARILERHSELLDGYKPDKAEVGVYLDPNIYNMEWVDKGSASEARDSLLGYLSALERLNVPYDVIESSHMDRLAGLKLLIMPKPEIVGESATRAIREFVERGGTVMTEAQLGSFTETGFYFYPGPDREIAYALGIEDLERRPILDEEFELVYGGQTFNLRADWYFTPLKTHVNGIAGTVLSTNSTGDVVSTTMQVGAGRVVSVGTFLGARYRRESYADFEEFVGELVRQAEASPKVTVSSSKSVYMRTGMSGSSRLVFLTSPDGSQMVTVKGSEEAFGGYTTARVLGRDCDIAIETLSSQTPAEPKTADAEPSLGVNGCDRQFQVSLDDCGYAVIELRR